MATATPPPTASRYYAASALVASQAASESLAVRPRGIRAAWEVLVRYQMRQALVAQEAVAQMLLDQQIEAEAEALLSAPAFTTSLDMFEQMAAEITADAEFKRLVDSITQDAGRAAQSVATAVRPEIGHVRYLNPPSCSRCAVLAGRVYRYSDGFERHTNCDCVMIPTTVANDQLAQDPVELMRAGQVTGLSKNDRKAIADGADFNQVVNVRLRSAGLQQSGRVLARRGRLTPEGIYRIASDRAAAVELLRQHGYIL